MGAFLEKIKSLLNFFQKNIWHILVVLEVDFINIAVKFCGGCNPRYDRKKIYDNFLTMLSKHHNFTGVDQNKIYDILIVLRGCTGCNDEYLEVKATHRYFIHDEKEASDIILRIKNL